jgi:hypothetical protein
MIGIGTPTSQRRIPRPMTSSKGSLIRGVNGHGPQEFLVTPSISGRRRGIDTGTSGLCQSSHPATAAGTIPPIRLSRPPAPGLRRDIGRSRVRAPAPAQISGAAAPPTAAAKLSIPMFARTLCRARRDAKIYAATATVNLKWGEPTGLERASYLEATAQRGQHA